MQESLTNALKHAGPDATATVRLRHIDDTVEIEVIDTGPGRTATAPSGRGIAGMAERAALHGGVVTAGPAPSGGWQVRTTLTVPPVDDS